MLKTFWDIGNDFAPERAAAAQQMRARWRKLFTWLLLMIVLNTTGLLLIHFDPRTAARAWTDVKSIGVRVKAHVERALEPPPPAAAGPFGNSPGPLFAVEIHRMMATMRWLVLATGFLLGLAGLLQSFAGRSASQYFAGAIGCFGFHALIGLMFSVI